MGIGEIVGLVLLGGALLIIVLAFRRLRLVRQGGIDVALRSRPNDAGRGWHQGVGRYRGDDFAWFGVSSLRSGPDRVFGREQLEIVERRGPTLPESYTMPSGSVVLRCRTDVDELELAMGEDTLTGFLSWLESAPPSSNPWAS
ncbi:MAG TPA: DUF2550 domain-containing protein [Pseudonocardiaceae bacterium]|jgi:hypothetical protein|nr:DUF2550 domain-containing protein [Pseudonocardiaceae bacterium]